MKTWLKHGIRLVVTGVLVGWIAFQIDLRSVGAVLQQANPAWIIAGVFVYLLSIVCAAWRWQLILRAMGTALGILTVVRLVIVGAFFNMFLPSSVGGDVMKMVLVAPNMERRELAVSSVLMDRVIGLVVTIGVGLGAVLLLPSVRDEPAVLTTLILAVAVLCTGMITIFNRSLLDLVERLMPSIIWGRIGPSIRQIQDSMLLIGQNSYILLQTAGVSVLRQIAICLSVFCVGVGFGLTLPLIAYFATVPIAVAITALPVAINGLGLQDNALILLFGTLGVTSAHALSLSIFLHAMRTGTGLLGGLIFAFMRGRNKDIPKTMPLIAVSDEPATEAKVVAD